MSTPSRAEPAPTLSDPQRLLLEYLEYYRATVLEKLEGLDEEELRRSRLPTGWSPLELLWHLAHVERRWLVWGFLGEELPDPWADWEEGRWAVPGGMPASEVVRRYQDQVGRSREIVADVPLAARAPVARGRFQSEAEAPTLGWILFHLLQEYARHAGHLDIARELADGATGE